MRLSIPLLICPNTALYAAEKVEHFVTVAGGGKPWGDQARFDAIALDGHLIGAIDLLFSCRGVCRSPVRSPPVTGIAVHNGQIRTIRTS